MIAIACEVQRKPVGKAQTGRCSSAVKGRRLAGSSRTPSFKPATPTTSSTDWHAGFLELLPGIQQYARRAFRYLGSEARDEAVTEVVANALVAYVRLVERGKEELAYPTVLARFAVAQMHDGRRIGNRLARHDVLGVWRPGVAVERLDRRDDEEDTWREAVVADTSTPVADQAAFRLDFPAWLARQTVRNRRVAQTLALGHGTGAVARRFGITSGRVSQLRLELRRSWSAFQGEAVVGGTA